MSTRWPQADARPHLRTHGHGHTDTPAHARLQGTAVGKTAPKARGNIPISPESPSPPPF